MKKKLLGKMGYILVNLSLALVIGCGFGSVISHAETLGVFSVTGGKNGTDYSYDSTNSILTIKTDTPVTVSGNNEKSGAAGHIYITGTKDVNLTISDLKLINMEWARAESPIQIEDNYSGKVTITLAGDNILSSEGTPAVMKNGTNALLVFNGSGSLKAHTSGNKDRSAWPAVIGGETGKGSGRIQIDGGTFTLNSYSGGSCIGGGSSTSIGSGGSGSNIVINGGTITANVAPYTTDKGVENYRTEYFGSNIGAAIGGGGNGDADGIYINGGTIITTVKTRIGTDIAGAAIGGGCNGAGNNIIIDGGTVSARVYNNTCGCGIGSGYKNTASKGWKSESSVTISGGYVVAYGFDKSAGIGGYGSSALADNATVNITGGKIVSVGGSDAPGIGGGFCSNVKVYISGGNVNSLGGKDANNAIGLENNTIERNLLGYGDYKASLQRSEEDPVEVSLQSLTESKLVNTAVKVSITDASGNPAEYDYYGIKDMTADNKGTVYVYLPAGYVLKSIEKRTEETLKDPDKITPDLKAVKWVYIQSGVSADYVSGTTKLSSNGISYELNVTNLPVGVKVEKYVTVKNETGFENTEIDNAQKDAGVYKTTVYFSVDDETSYNVPDPIDIVWTVEESGLKLGDDGKQYEEITDADGNPSGKVAYEGDDNSNVTSVKVPDTVTIDGKKYQVTEVKAGAFANNKKLKKITIGKNVTKIGDKAFYKCTNLTSVIIPSKVTKIGKNAFYGCKKLKKITIKSKKLKSVGKNAIKGIHKKATIKCPSKSIAKKYKKLFKSSTGYKKSMKIK